MKKLIYTCAIISLFLSSSPSYGFSFDLEETPVDTYKVQKRPKIDPLPSSHYLKMTTVKDQGPLGTCASFTVSACGEFHYKKYGVKFSEAEFTVLGETRLPTEYGGNCKPGINLGKMLHLARSYGFVSEDKLPYSPYLKYVATKNDIQTSRSDWLEKLWKKTDPHICTRFENHPKESYNTTMKEMGINIRLYDTSADIGYQLPKIYPIHHVSRESLTRTLNGQPVTETCIGQACQADLQWVKHALTIGHPVAVALPVFGKTERQKRTTNWDHDQLFGNTIRLPRDGEKIIGSHAIVLTGFNDVTRIFQLKNSWGLQWGNFGFADIPYDYIRVFATELVGVGN